MSLPESQDRTADDDPPREGARPPGSDAVRPDWLVGAREGATSERPQLESGERPESPLRLIKPGQTDPAAGTWMRSPSPAGRPLPKPEQHAPSAAVPIVPARPVAWSAAASSVPRPRLEAPPPSPEPARGLGAEDEPLADPGRSEFADAGFPGDGPETPAAATEVRALAPLHEPGWMVALDHLRASRGMQIVICLALLVLVAAWICWPRGEPGVSLSTLRHHPERFDGLTVRVKGRVGEVFRVGGGYAFGLIQGRDTIVVFTRSRVPAPRQRVTVVASVSTGFLDGAPRQALFETTP